MLGNFSRFSGVQYKNGQLALCFLVAPDPGNEFRRVALFRQLICDSRPICVVAAAGERECAI